MKRNVVTGLIVICVCGGVFLKESEKTGKGERVVA